jgi:hypothetical protein
MNTTDYKEMVPSSFVRMKAEKIFLQCKNIKLLLRHFIVFYLVEILLSSPLAFTVSKSVDYFFSRLIFCHEPNLNIPHSCVFTTPSFHKFPSIKCFAKSAESHFEFNLKITQRSLTSTAVQCRYLRT